MDKEVVTYARVALRHRHAVLSSKLFRHMEVVILTTLGGFGSTDMPCLNSDLMKLLPTG